MQSEESPAYPATTGLPGRSVFPEPWLGQGNTELASRVAATAALLSAGIGVDSNRTQSLAVCEQSHKENNLQRSVIRNSTPGLPLHEIMSLPTSTTSQQQAAATTIMNVSQMASAANGAGLASQSTNTGGASGNSSSTSASSQFQKLKVEDALSYLDQVKLQFGNQPQVYNDFLDIMKEFKSQSIDTPGVISRVSNLFKGHPDLIVGFNTFLPPGFKIEVHHNEINISGPAQHSHTLAKIAQAHNSSTNAASSFGSSKDNSTTPTGASAGGTQANPSSSTDQSPSGSFQSPHQPVEFNHAINYVNKIKNRFQQHPDIYKAFLEILHKYQKEQRIIKEGGTPQTTPLSESEVYSQVSGLFQNQEDLLSEFGQFLPDATASFSSLPLGPPPLKKQALSSSSTKNSKPAHGRKGSQSGANSSGGPSKKPKSSAKDVLAEAGKHTNYAELALFDKIQKSFRNQEVYNNFLRCLVLFNEELISRNELVQLVTPFLGKYPELFTSFKTLLGFKEPGLPEQLPTTSPTPPFPPKERVTDFAAEIDYKSLKRHGASYRALPKTYVQPKCSGRSLLCKEVLNDMWVSFPMWSEDSTFEGTRKTQFEEYIFRCEDERFELDVVLETNLSTIKYLEALQKKMAKMSPEELAVYTHDITLGGNSEVLQRKAIHRIYGDKAHDIIDGLMKSPNVAVPVVLKRLKAKQEEWMEAQRAFNKVWRDQLEKYYLKSLDHQGINFKQVDTRAMRSKAMCAEVEAIFDERQEQMVEGASASGPHLKLSLQMDPCIFNDAVGLVLYYTKRASSLQHSDALKIRSFLTHTMADLCFYPRVEVSSEDDISLDSDSDAMDVDTTSNDTDTTQQRASSDKTGSGALVPDTSPQYIEMDYHVIFANNSVYSFFRLFQLLCERLNRIYQQALASIKEETEQSSGSVPIAVQLGLKKLPDIKVDEYYPTFLSMAKNFMEGNIDATTYEDTCREMFGVHAYVVFTIDRLVQNIVRQLLAMVVDSNCYQVMVHYNTFVEQLNPNQTKADTRTGSEMAYQRKIEAFLGEDNCYRITITRKDQVMSVELLDTDDAGDEENQHEIKKWQTYVEKYAEPEADPELSEILAKSKIFLKRSLRHMPPPNSSEEEELKVKGSLPDMEVSGAIEFKMDKKSYRMIPLAKSEDYLYNKQSLKRAREVNNHVFAVKHSKFEKWHSKWLEAHTTQEDATQCSDWLLGKTLPSSNHPEAPQTPEPLSQSHEETYQGHKRTRYTTHNTSRDNSIVCSEQMSTD